LPPSVWQPDDFFGIDCHRLFCNCRTNDPIRPPHSEQIEAPVIPGVHEYAGCVIIYTLYGRHWLWFVKVGCQAVHGNCYNLGAVVLRHLARLDRSICTLRTSMSQNAHTLAPRPNSMCRRFPSRFSSSTHLTSTLSILCSTERL
jgi:hypothetical protein